jgi:hypothetical protein
MDIHLHFYILVLEHLGIVLFELSGNFELVAGLELVGNFVWELVGNFVWEPKIHSINIEYFLFMHLLL